MCLFEDLLEQNEGKTLEFKENTKSLTGLIKTIIAFANTSGGNLVIGVQDKTKKVIGLEDVLLEEERLASAIADSISPLLVPDIEIKTYAHKDVLIIRVPHIAGPCYLKSAGEHGGAYVRFGSTNRLADEATRVSLRLFSANLSYDETPQSLGKLDTALLKKIFQSVGKDPTEKKCEMLGILSSRLRKICPSVGGILLFGENREELFPDAIVRCARFKGIDKEKILDQKEISSPLSLVIDEAILFVERNTRLGAEIGRIHRKDIPEYPSIAVREAIINALLHTDYSVRGSHIQIAIFSNRIEFTNPGGFPFGQTMEKALAGFSCLRNRVIGRVFRELNLIEQWGSGLQRILSSCVERDLKKPEIAEHSNQFRLTLFSSAED